MMKTPICDFVRRYASSSPLRLHMPGHKGKGPLGVEEIDITEISGADVLYHESGILKESQENASLLFQSGKTLYSTEGSTLCIRAMLQLARIDAKERGKEFVLGAERHAHRSFFTGCALLGIEPLYFPSRHPGSLFSGVVSPDDLRSFFREQEKAPTAIYITSPDYLGNVSDISEISEVCRENDCLLLVDNAHGAYLSFLPDKNHPLAQGADLVCDSAHKTLPVLTGGAYLHLSRSAPPYLLSQAESVMALFSSTSPSYLILQSLDACNAYLCDDFSRKLTAFAGKVHDLKKTLMKLGFSLVGNEPLKITVQTKPSGYTGDELSVILQEMGIYCEFSDPDHLVMMLSPSLEDEALERIADAFSKIPQRNPILVFPPKIPFAEKGMTLRDAVLSPCEKVSIEDSVGRILSKPDTSCPPAVPILLCGERIEKEHLPLFRYYGIMDLQVVK